MAAKKSLVSQVRAATMPIKVSAKIGSKVYTATVQASKIALAELFEEQYDRQPSKLEMEELLIQVLEECADSLVRGMGERERFGFEGYLHAQKKGSSRGRKK